MEIQNNKDDVDRIRDMPHSPFLARQYNISSGPLCIVARCSGINPASYSVMFLEGTGGPAVGDAWHSLTEDKVRAQFIPIENSVTLKNRW